MELEIQILPEAATCFPTSASGLLWKQNSLKMLGDGLHSIDVQSTFCRPPSASWLTAGKAGGKAHAERLTTKASMDIEVAVQAEDLGLCDVLAKAGHHRLMQGLL